MIMHSASIRNKIGKQFAILLH